jgi:hypothetical protein
VQQFAGPALISVPAAISWPSRTTKRSSLTLTLKKEWKPIAARKPLHGAAWVARAWIGISRRYGAAARRSLVEINGATGVLVEGRAGGRTALAFTVDGGRIVRIDAMRNPAKLRF